MEVYRKLGAGFYEAVYNEALKVEFARRNIPYEPEKRFDIAYKDVILKKQYCADFLCFNQIIVPRKEKHTEQEENMVYPISSSFDLFHGIRGTHGARKIRNARKNKIS